MARRLGAERLAHYASLPEQFGSKGGTVLVGEYSGCWVEEVSSSEGESGHESVAATLANLWIPRAVELRGGDDHFVWAKHPDERYETTGKARRIYARRGVLRAVVIPVRAVT